MATVNYDPVFHVVGSANDGPANPRAGDFLFDQGAGRGFRTAPSPRARSPNKWRSDR